MLPHRLWAVHKQSSSPNTRTVTWRMATNTWVTGIPLVTHPETDQIWSHSGVSDPAPQTITLQLTVRASYVETPSYQLIFKKILLYCSTCSSVTITVYHSLSHSWWRLAACSCTLQEVAVLVNLISEPCVLLQDRFWSGSQMSCSSMSLIKAPVTDCTELHWQHTTVLLPLSSIPNPPPPSISCPQVNGSPVATLLLSHHTPPWGTWGRSICVTLLRWSPGNVPKDNQCTHQLRPTRLTPARSAPAFGG